jgi:hypothetical protein
VRGLSIATNRVPARSTCSRASILDRFRDAIASRIGGRRKLKDIRIGDVRFGASLPQLCANPETSLADLLSNPKIIKHGIGPKRLRIGLSKTLENVKRMQGITLGQEIEEIANARVDNTAVCYRLGLYGDPKMTLEAAGELAGVTRERIRQKEKKFKGVMVDCPPYTPVLNRAIEALDNQLAQGINDVEQIKVHMQSEGILGQDDNVRQIIAFAELKGVERHVLIDNGAQTIAMRAEDVAQMTEAVRVARQFINDETRSFGVCSIDALTTALEQAGHGNLLSSLSIVVDNVPGIDWIEAGGWLRSTKYRPAFVTPAMKILSISPEIRLSDLRKGLQRNTQRIGLVPPKRILAKILMKEFGESYGLELDGDVLTARTPLSPHDILAYQEQQMYDIFEANGRVMSRVDLERKATVKGINLSSFHIALSYWPIIDCYAKGVYGLRGTRVQPGLVEALAPKDFKKVRTVKDYGHLKDGRIWVVAALSDYNVRYATIGLPAALRDYVGGAYAIRVGREQTSYESSVSVGQIRLLGHFLKASGAEAGDYILLVFDNENSAVSVSLGGENIVGNLDERFPDDCDDGHEETA